MIRAMILLVLLVGCVDERQLTQDAEELLNAAHQQVVRDFEEQYRITRLYGTSVDICVQAGLVAEAHLQAKNEVSYKRWKVVESSDCALVGLR